MEITVNAERTQVGDVTSLTDLVRARSRKQIDDRGFLPDGRAIPFAVALNGDVVPRAAWATTHVRAGDVVDLVTAMPGG